MAISDKITSMTNHLTADYDAIESVVGEVTVDKNIENIAPLINNLYEELPKVTASGTELTINDTRAGKMKVQPMGNTSQTQKTGKNLLSLPFSSSSQFGITVTKNSDGTLTVNGTATADAAVIFNTSVTLSAGTYTLSGCPSGGSSSTYNLNLDQLSTMRDNGSGVTFTLNSERTSTAYVSVKSGVTMNNVIFKPMIVSGSTSGDFEPYTGKKATPNPDNPEQVHTCSGDNEVVVSGENRLNPALLSQVSGYNTYNSTTGLWTTNTGTNTSYNRSIFYDAVGYSANRDIDMIIKVKPNTAYTLKFYDATMVSYTLGLYKSDGTNITSFEGTTATLKTFSTPSNCVGLDIRRETPNTQLVFSKIMLIEGTYTSETLPPYEPYQSSTYPIHLGTYELCKIGTYQDYFTKNSDGQWCKYNAIGKVVLDGSENWTDFFSTTGFYRYTPTVASLNTTDTINCICNYYKGTTRNEIRGLSSSANNKCSIYSTELVLVNTSITSINDFKTWLSTHNTIVYYVLATPYLSLIEDNNLIEQLDNLQNAMSYSGTTNINQVNDDLPFIIDASALKGE